MADTDGGLQNAAAHPCRAGGTFTRLLWTGGWDSTFRLLQLLLDQGRSVEPHYLVDPKRPSASVEQETMDAIRTHLNARYPRSRSLLLPSRIVDVRDVPPDEEVHNMFLRLDQRWNIGSQYDWLARYCKHLGLEGVEMGTEPGGSFGDVMVAGRNTFLRSVDDGYGRVYVVAPDDCAPDVGAVFRYYRFPLLEISKAEMARTADERGWREIMVMTWFCHSPRHRRTACGLCPPCRHTIEMGLQWRLPLRSRCRFYVTPRGMRFLLRDHRHLYSAGRAANRLRRSLHATPRPLRP